MYLKHQLWLIVCLSMIALPMMAQNSQSYAGAGFNAQPWLTAVSANATSFNPAVESALPDAPSSAHESTLSGFNMAVAAGQAPVPVGRQGISLNRKTLDKQFFLVTGALFGSTVANIELTMRCRQAAACSLVPDSIAQRHKLYPLTFGADGGVTLLGYYLKSHHHRYWFVPAAAFITGNAIYAIHASRYMR